MATRRRAGFVGQPRRSRWDRFWSWARRRGAVDMVEWGGFALILIILGALLRFAPFALAGAAILTLALVLRTLGDRAFSRFTYSREISAERAEVGDQVRLVQRLENRGPLPLSHLEVDQACTWQTRLSRSIQLQDRALTMFSLGPFQRLEQTHVLDCRYRGWHRLGPTTLRATDPIGAGTAELVDEARIGVLVWPRRVPVGGHELLPARAPLGDQRPQTPFVEDPVRFAGVREYVAGDAPRKIHWRATARGGDLQTRVLEPSAAAQVMVVVDTGGPRGGVELDPDLERRIVVAASLANDLLRRRVPVGVLTTSVVTGQRCLSAPPGRSPRQARVLLDTLSRAGTGLMLPLQRVVARQVARLPWETAVVIVTDRLDGELQRTLLRLVRGSRRPVSVVVTGDDPTLLPGVAQRVRVLRVDGKEAWDELSALRLVA